MGWSGSAMVLGKLPVPGRPAGLGSGGALFVILNISLSLHYICLILLFPGQAPWLNLGNN